MLHASTKRLIDTLGDRTRKQRVGWVESEDGSVTHDTEGYRVIITPDPHTVLITDALGKNLDEVTPEEYADVVDDDGRPYAMFMSELFREASRHARGTERAIEALLAGLDRDGDGIPDEPIAEAEPDIEETIEDIGDDTHIVDDESTRDMKDAVANLADQVNGDAAEAEASEFVEPGEPVEPGSDASSSILAAGAGVAAAAAAATFSEPESVDGGPGDQDAADMHFNQVETPEPEAPEPIDPATLANVPPEEAPASNPFTAGPKGALKMTTGFGDVVEYKSESDEHAPAADIPELSDEVSDTIREAATPLSETEQSISDALAGLSDKPATSAPVEAAQPARPKPRSFSLSGIGTGFGLGATTGAVAAGLHDTVEDTAIEVSEQASPVAEDVHQDAVGFVDGTSDLPDKIDLPDAVEDVADAAADSLSAAGETIADTAEAAKDTAENTAGAARGGMASLLSGVASKAGDGVEAVKDAAGNAAESAADAAEEAVDAVKPTGKPTKRFNPWT